MRQERILNAVLLCAAIVTVTSSYQLVRRNWRRSVTETVITPSWRAISTAGERIGPAAAPITIVEFGDFQCPYCARTASDLRSIRTKYGDRVAVVFRHFPLNQHPEAVPAAEAAECAAAQGHFEEFYNRAYEQQRYLGERSLTWFASSAGVTDTARFQACLAVHEGQPAILRDIASAESLSVTSTPTVFVNDRRIIVAPTMRLMDSLVEATLRRRNK